MRFRMLAVPLLTGLMLMITGCGKKQDEELVEYSEIKITPKEQSDDLDEPTPEASPQANAKVPLIAPLPLERADGTRVAVYRVPVTAPKPELEQIQELANASVPKPGPRLGVLTIDNSADEEPLEIKLLIPEKQFEEIDDEGTLLLTYDDFDLLKILNMRPVTEEGLEQLPSWLTELEGKRVRLRGFMYPTFQDFVPIFGFARDNQICCFVRQPKPYDLLTVVMEKGTKAPYVEGRPIDVEGTFHIKPWITKSGRIKEIYRIHNARVVSKKR